MDHEKANSFRRHRKSIRLEGYNYSQEGSYFITVVTKNREPLFGEIVAGLMVLNELGSIVKEEWLKTAQLRENVEICEDEFVVMPNHFHGIIHLFVNSGRGDWPVENESCHPTVGAYGHTPLQKMPFRSPARSLGALVRGFKSSVTTRINQIRNTPGLSVWQHNYYDHIIGTDHEFETIAQYICDNPLNWLTDKEHNWE